MKKLFLLSAVFFSINSFSQTNTFPSSGNVGIGTTNPQYKLDVFGNIRVTDTVFTSGVVITDAVKADTGRIGVIADDVSLIGNVGIGGGVLPSIKLNVVGDARISGKLQAFRIVPLSGDSIIRFGDSTISINTNTNSITWTPSNVLTVGGLSIGNGESFAGGQNSLAIGFSVGTSGNALNGITIGSGVNTIDKLTNGIPNTLMVGFNSDIPTLFVGASGGVNTTGNVGIATTNPTEKLQVNSGNILIKGANNFMANGNTAVLYLGDNYNFIKTTFGGGVTLGVWDGVSASTDAINIANGGNVGIGTPPSTIYKLVVEGTLGAREIKVNLNLWPDYVFHKNYKLMPLDSVQKFTLKYKHLPGMPSADDLIKDGGLSLGKMQTLQMEKIEDSYLYLFQFGNKITALEQENALLKQQIILLQQK